MEIKGSIGGTLSRIGSTMRKKRLISFINNTESIWLEFNKFSSAFLLESHVQSSYFDALGIMPTKDINMIKEAYRNTIKKYHPDVNKNPDANTITKRANEAYDALVKRNGSNGRRSGNSLVVLSNALTNEYNELMERNYKKLKETLSHGPVERWFYVQELDAFLDYKKRVKESYARAFGGFFKLKSNVHKLYIKGLRLSKDRYYSNEEKLHSSILRLAQMEEQCLQISTDIDKIRKEFYKAAQKSSSELRARLAL